MARIAGTGGPSSKRRRIRVPSIHGSPLLLAVIFVAIALRATDPFIQALAVGFAVAATWAVGYFEGRAAVSRELLLDDLRRDDRAT
jgi:hypothetical protein